MKLILTDNLPKLGKIGDVVTVKNGYGKNYLVPNKKAICYTEQNYKSFADKKAEFEKLSSEKLAIANKVKESLLGKNIIIIENASDDGRLYGSVNTSVIANKINDVINEKLVDKSVIFLSKPIKEIGIYETKLNLHSDLILDIKLLVSRSESEAMVLLNPKKKSKKDSDDQENQLTSSEGNSEEEVEQNAVKAKKPRKKKSEE